MDTKITTKKIVVGKRFGIEFTKEDLKTRLFEVHVDQKYRYKEAEDEVKSILIKNAPAWLSARRIYKAIQDNPFAKRKDFSYSYVYKILARLKKVNYVEVKKGIDQKGRIIMLFRRKYY